MVLRIKVIFLAFVCFLSAVSGAQSAAPIDGSTPIYSIKPEQMTIKVLSQAKMNLALNSYRRFIDTVNSGRPVSQRDRVESWPSLRIVFLGGHLYTIHESSSLCADVYCNERSVAALVGLSKKFEEIEKVPQVLVNEILQVESIKANPKTSTVDVIVKDKNFEFTFQSLGATLDDAKSDFKGTLEIQVK